jgi:hypothetical protein
VGVEERVGRFAGHLGTSISGLRQRYDLGGGHDQVGRSAPEIVLAAGWPSCCTTAGVCCSATSRSTTTACTSPPPKEGPAMLVRPDGIVAWVEGDGDLDAALQRWFGGVRRG